MVRFLAFLGIGYLCICAAMYFLQDGLLFFPRPNDADATRKLAPHAWQTSNGVNQLTGWLMPAPEPARAPLVLYFGGNGQDVAEVAEMRAHVANTLYVNYRGYGSSTGRPSESAFFADALHVYDAATREFDFNGRVILHGRSMGSGVAVHLAAERPVDGLVLITPYDSIVAVAQSTYWFLPAGLLLKHRFDSLSRIDAISAPAFILIAEKDQIIPPQHADNLARHWRGLVEVLRVPGANHLTATSAAETMARINDFILRVGGSAD